MNTIRFFVLLGLLTNLSSHAIAAGRSHEILGIGPGSSSEEVKRALAAAGCQAETAYEGPHHSLGERLPIVVLRATGCRTRHGAGAAGVTVVLTQDRTFHVRVGFPTPPERERLEQTLGKATSAGEREALWYDTEKDVERRLFPDEHGRWEYEMRDYRTWLRVGIMTPKELAFQRAIAEEMARVEKEIEAERGLGEILGLAAGISARAVERALAAAGCKARVHYDGPNLDLKEPVPLLVLKAQGCKTRLGQVADDLSVLLTGDRVFHVIVFFDTPPDLARLVEVLGPPGVAKPPEATWLDEKTDIVRWVQSRHDGRWEYEMRDYRAFVSMGMAEPEDLVRNREQLREAQRLQAERRRGVSKPRDCVRSP